jgi:hypothetical protein
MIDFDGDDPLGTWLMVAGTCVATFGSYATFGPYVTAIWVGALVAWLGWRVM